MLLLCRRTKASRPPEWLCCSSLSFRLASSRRARAVPLPAPSCCCWPLAPQTILPPLPTDPSSLLHLSLQSPSVANSKPRGTLSNLQHIALAGAWPGAVREAALHATLPLDTLQASNDPQNLSPVLGLQPNRQRKGLVNLLLHPPRADQREVPHSSLAKARRREGSQSCVLCGPDPNIYFKKEG